MKLFNKLDKQVLSVYEKEKRIVFITVFVLVVLHFPMQYLFDTGNILGLETIHELLDLDGEDAFGAWASQAMLLISGVSVLLYKGVAKYIRYSVGPLLLLLSIDEIISLHERFIDYFLKQDITGVGFFNFTWLYIGVPLALAIVAWLLYVFMKSRNSLPNGLFIGILVFLIGAVVFEGIAGILTMSELQYSVFMVGAEESIELLGIVIIFITVWGIETLNPKRLSKNET